MLRNRRAAQSAGERLSEEPERFAWLLQPGRTGLLTELGRIGSEDLMLETADKVCAVQPQWAPGAQLIRIWSGRSARLERDVLDE